MTISVILPTYNEVNEIGNCLSSLKKQTRKFQLVVVDDGSTDGTFKVIDSKVQDFSDIKLIKGKHLGPGAARNLGAKYATGEILVFIDADMTCKENYLEQLIKPIETRRTKGTFTKAEFVANWDNIWARNWNYNLNLPDKKRLPDDYPDYAPVFRAILATEFTKVSGFTTGIGWTDDWTLSRKLGYQSLVTQAICYHANPSTLREVFYQANWIGKNEYMTRDVYRVFYSLVRHSLPVSLTVGLIKSLIFSEPLFVLFKINYDLGITVGVLKSLLGFHKNK